MILPAEFIAETRSLLGIEEYNKLISALEQEPSVSLRVHAGKLHNSILSTFPPSDAIPWCANGFYLDKRLTFTFDPLFHAGCYYVQEASSMFLEQVLKQHVTNPVTMLDLCAAPGGKSTHARSLLPEGSLLVANEVIRSRSYILAENLTKWGHSDVVVTNNDPADFSKLANYFDVILTDVPCSGEGMFRKDEGAIAEWSTGNVEICHQRQQRIIADIWPCLKPGGILIYSTCTYNTKENEENVAWIKSELGAESLSVELPETWGVTGNLAGMDFPVYRFLPHKTQGEGFFLAVLRKDGDEKEFPGSFRDDTHSFVLPKNKKNRKGFPAAGTSLGSIATVAGWIHAPEEYRLSASSESVVAVSKVHTGKLAVLEQTLKVIQAGVTLGEQRGKDLIPAHALAMSEFLNRDAFITQEVSYEQAIAYLRKEAITFDAGVPRGFVLVTYKDTPLGFVKNIGNRANNLYPQEWRIRSGYLPGEIRVL